MKLRIILILQLIAWTIVLSAQNTGEGIRKENKARGYFSIMTETPLHSYAGFTVGAAGGVELNRLIIGGYYATSRREEVIYQREWHVGKFNNYGLSLQYPFLSNQAVHLYSGLRLGSGIAEFSNDKNEGAPFSDRLYIINPEIGIEFDLLSWCYFRISGSYRWVESFENSDFSESIELNRYAVGTSLRFYIF